MNLKDLKVINCPIWCGDNAILVENIDELNCVYNVPTKVEYIRKERLPQTIGVWKNLKLKS